MKYVSNYTGCHKKFAQLFSAKAPTGWFQEKVQGVLQYVPNYTTVSNLLSL